MPRIRVPLLPIACAFAVVVAGCGGTAPTVPPVAPASVVPPTLDVASASVTPVPTEQAVAETMWCEWADLGETITAGDKRLNFACDTGDPASQVGLFGEIENTDLGWVIAAAPVTVTADGPVAGEATMVTVDYIRLEDGTTCANAGHGATTGYDDMRLNYTCEVPSGEQTGLFGDVEVVEDRWQITKATFNITPGGPTVTAPAQFIIQALGVPPLSTAP